jgi:hypothetical protein
MGFSPIVQIKNFRRMAWQAILFTLFFTSATIAIGCEDERGNVMDVRAKKHPEKLDTPCLSALRTGFEQERMAYEAEFSIQGGWKSDTAIEGWLVAGLTHALPKEKEILRCPLAKLNWIAETGRADRDSIFSLIAQQDWLQRGFKKKLRGMSSKHYSTVFSHYARLDSLCKADYRGDWANEIAGPKWLEYQLWGFDHFRFTAHKAGLVMPGIFSSGTDNGLMDLFIQYRLECQSETVILCRTIFNHAAIGDQEITW